jgi:hypothetical protein
MRARYSVSVWRGTFSERHSVQADSYEQAALIAVGMSEDSRGLARGALDPALVEVNDNTYRVVAAFHGKALTPVRKVTP